MDTLYLAGREPVVISGPWTLKGQYCGSCPLPQIFVDQLTLFQIMSTKLIPAPRIFRPSYGPVDELLKSQVNLDRQSIHFQKGNASWPHPDKKIIPDRIRPSKGQLNSERIYDVIVSPKLPTKNYQNFCPGSLLEGKAEILKIFGWHFGRNDDLMNSFWI